MIANGSRLQVLHSTVSSQLGPCNRTENATEPYSISSSPSSSSSACILAAVVLGMDNCEGRREEAWKETQAGNHSAAALVSAVEASLSPPLQSVSRAQDSCSCRRESSTAQTRSRSVEPDCFQSKKKQTAVCGRALFHTPG